MILAMYTDSTINELRTNIKLNFCKYKQKECFVKKFIPNYEAQLYPLNIEVEYPQLNKKIANRDEEIKQWEIDYENAINLYKNFVLKYNISLQILADERFISYLTHDIYYDYMVTRWPIKEGKESRIKEKYFLPSGNQAFTRNAFLKFFWYPYITYDEKNNDHYHLTKIAFEYADPVNQIMERKYSKNPKIVRAALKAIENVENSKILNIKRTLYGKAINNILSLYCLDILNEDALTVLLESEIKKIILSDIVDDEILKEE